MHWSEGTRSADTSTYFDVYIYNNYNICKINLNTNQSGFWPRCTFSDQVGWLIIQKTNWTLNLKITVWLLERPIRLGTWMGLVWCWWCCSDRSLVQERKVPRPQQGWSTARTHLHKGESSGWWYSGRYLRGRVRTKHLIHHMVLDSSSFTWGIFYMQTWGEKIWYGLSCDLGFWTPSW